MSDATPTQKRCLVPDEPRKQILRQTGAGLLPGQKAGSPTTPKNGFGVPGGWSNPFVQTPPSQAHWDDVGDLGEYTFVKFGGEQWRRRTAPMQPAVKTTHGCTGGGGDFPTAERIEATIESCTACRSSEYLTCQP